MRRDAVVRRAEMTEGNCSTRGAIWTLERYRFAALDSSYTALGVFDVAIAIRVEGAESPGRWVGRGIVKVDSASRA